MPNIVRFDGFDVDCDARQLHKRGLRVKLRDQSPQRRRRKSSRVTTRPG